MKTGIQLIAEERQRQIDVEGWTELHDNCHKDGDMAQAAVCYVTGNNDGWPWGEQWWKPKDRVRDLVRAGALIAAEIDRIQRMERGLKAVSALND